MKKFVLLAGLLLTVAHPMSFAADTTQPSSAPVPELATVPKVRTETAWVKRHNSLMVKAKAGNIDLYLEGDSITDFWQRKFKENLQKNLGGWKPGDFGVSADRTQNVLWRLENGELDGVKPKVIMLLIGTNNLPPKAEFQGNTPEDTAKGIKAILDVFAEKEPQAKVLLMGVFPRGDRPPQINEDIDKINSIIANYADGTHVRYVNINKQLLDADGKLTRDILPDLLHPNEKGYQIWADAIRPTLVEWLGEPAPTTQP